MTSSDSRLGARLLPEFPFAAGYLNINHGSFGAHPLAVREALQNFQHQVDAQPDVFIRYKLPELIDKSRSAVAQLINADVDNVVLVPNASTGLNTVLRNLTYEKGDKLVYLSTTYSGVEKALIEIADKCLPEGTVEALRVEIEYPISNDEILRRFERAISQDGVRVALFDTVSSLPALRLPFEKMVALCKKYNVYSVIDAAHAVGCIKLDMRALDADFLVSNLHKWLYAPRSCAILHVPARNQHLLKTTYPTSHGYRPAERPGRPKINNPLPEGTKSPFVQLFEFVGTLDYTSWLCVPEAIRFRVEKCGGEEKILQYTTTLAKQGGKRIADMLKTEVLGDEDQRECPMAMVRLPVVFSAEDIKEGRQHSIRAGIEDSMFRKHGTFIPVICHGDHLWARLSGQAYLTLEDFEKAGHILLSGVQMSQSAKL